ncbi:restriction endonuclease [soil metagenome]
MPSNRDQPISVPAYQEYLWPTLQALKVLGNSGSIQEINDEAISSAGLTDEQLAILHGNGPGTEVAYRMAWARSYLKKVGAVTNTSRGVWAITELGLDLDASDMASIPGRVRKLHIRTNNFKNTQISEPPIEGNLSKRLASSNVIDSQKSTVALTTTDPDVWRTHILDALLGMSPDGFERLCQRVLRESGFTKVEVTGKTGDGGIDGIGVLRVSLLSFHVFFQCKRYRGSVGASAIRDFRGAMVGRTDKGLLITTGTFTPDAKKEATRDGAPVLDLIDGDALSAILRGLELGVSTALVEEVTVDADWFRQL